MKLSMRIALGSITVCLALSGFSSATKSQTLDEWKAALEAKRARKGCDSIPYSNYRDSCKEHQKQVNEYCGKDDDANDRIGTPWNCNELGTKALREQIKGISEKLESLKKEKDRLSNEKASTQSVEREIDNRSKELEFKKKSLETDIKDIEIRIDRGHRCIDARKEVQYAFKSAKSSASGVNDPEAGQISKELREWWESKESGHDKAIDYTREGISKCEKCKSGDL
jgi:chromosome segregation ATPase